jgi:hypothetical protein
MTLPGDVDHSTARAIVDCYGYLIRSEIRWTHGLPAPLRNEIELLIGYKKHGEMERQNQTVRTIRVNGVSYPATIETSVAISATMERTV